MRNDEYGFYDEIIQAYESLLIGGLWSTTTTHQAELTHMYSLPDLGLHNPDRSRLPARPNPLKPLRKKFILSHSGRRVTAGSLAKTPR
jgi:hypothetical protein